MRLPTYNSMIESQKYNIIVGDCLHAINNDIPLVIPFCCVTSPPYYGLRSYGVQPTTWNDGSQSCLGEEETPEAYVIHLVEIFHALKGILNDKGSLWLNLGDSYYDSQMPLGRKENISIGTGIGVGQKMLANIAKPKKRPKHPILKNKDLIGIPWRVAFALQADGWYLRNEVIWNRPNPLPEGHVKDRCHRAHEHLFLLTKKPIYYFDADAVKENAKDGTLKNRRTVWTVPVGSSTTSHVAIFPEKLIEPCILASCPKGETVIDIFSGTATTGAVALRFGRKYIGIEMNAEHAEESKGRLDHVLQSMASIID